MTQKELLYVKDAVEHEKSIVQILENTKKNLEDESLVSFCDSEIEKHNTLCDSLINLLEEKANG